MASEAPIIRLAHDLITRAVDMQASDIHVEPREDSLARALSASTACCIRSRRLPLSLRAAVTSRIKIMAQLNIAERRLPQDGRIKTTVHGTRDRLARFDHADAVRRKRRAAHPRPLQRAARLPGAGVCRTRRTRPLPSCSISPNGIILVTGPDRQRQDHHALHRAERAQHRRAQDLHRRGPDRVPARRRQPDPGAAARSA